MTITSGRIQTMRDITNFVKKWSTFFEISTEVRDCGTYSIVVIGDSSKRPVIFQTITQNIANDIYTDVNLLLAGKQSAVRDEDSQLLSYIGAASNFAGDVKGAKFIFALQKAIDSKYTGQGFDSSKGSLGDSWWNEELN